MASLALVSPGHPEGNGTTNVPGNRGFVAPTQQFVVFKRIWCCSTEKRYANIASFFTVCLFYYLG